MPKRWFCGLFCGFVLVGIMLVVTSVAYADNVTAAQEDCTQQDLELLYAKTGIIDNGTCVATSCINGYELVDKVCVSKGSGCEPVLLSEAHATTGYMENEMCIPTECQNGYVLEEKQCVKRGNGCSAAALEELHATAGYFLDNVCTPTVCISGYDLEESRCVRRSGGTSGGGGTTVTADCGKNLFNPQLLIESGLTSYNTSTYTFTGRFTRDYSTTTKSNTGDFTGNHYMSHYSYGLVPNTEYELVYTIKCDDDPDDNTIHSYHMLMGLTTKTGNATDYARPTVGQCSNGVATVTTTAGGNGTSVTGVYIARATGVTKDFSGELSISKVMLVLSDEDTSTMIPYGPCIKISTKKSTETRATGVESRLSNLRTMIDHLITRTQTNATNVGTLNTNKTTRPADEATDDCQTGDSCLLIKDVNGANHWYKIETCEADSVLANVGTMGPSVSYGVGEPWGYQASGVTDPNLMCSGNPNVGCQDDEWVTAYNVTNGVPDKIIFGTASRVAIAERTSGQIVSLPNGVQSGDVCVCKATRYKLWDSDTNSFGANQTITTDKWLVVGQASSYGSCLNACGDGGKANYLANISNTCTGAASVAGMCRYYSLFGTVGDLVGTTNFTMAGGGDYAYGGVDSNGGLLAGCVSASGNDSVTDTGHCGTETSNRGTWVTKYYSGSNHTNLVGYVYGFEGYVSVPAGTAVGDVIDVNVNDVSTTYSDQDALVCVVKGFKAAGDSSDTNLTTTKAYVTNLSANNAVLGTGCVEPSVMLFGPMYSELSNMCFAY